MPSVFSHAIAAVAIGGVAVGGPRRVTIWTLGAICAVVPDLDVISFHFGLPYGHMLGHRGLSHSLPFAAVLAAIVTVFLHRIRTTSASVGRLWAFFFLATASHGVLDAMTDGALGWRSSRRSRTPATSSPGGPSSSRRSESESSSVRVACA